MQDDRFDGLLESPLADPDPGRRARRRRLTFLTVGTALLIGAAITVILVAGGDEDEATTTTGVPGATTSITTTLPSGVAGFPDPRVYSRMVATESGILMFGGLEPLQNLNGMRYADVWRYDPVADQWWDLRTPGGPSPRAGAAVVYDAGSDLVVLFGGAPGNCRYPICPEASAETWVYDPAANTWERRSADPAPSARHGHGLAYDAASDRVVLFGGDSTENWLDDTWSYDTDADAWTEIAAVGDPPPRRALYAMSYDPDADRVLLWGGADWEHTLVWAFDLEGASWEEFEFDPAPAAAWDACLVWDPALRRSVLIGGEGYTVEEIADGVTSTAIRVRDEVWALDLSSGTWEQLQGLSEPTTRHTCTRDPDSGIIVVWTEDGVVEVDPVVGGPGPAD
jgi:hypothetical protein